MEQLIKQLHEAINTLNDEDLKTLSVEFNQMLYDQLGVRYIKTTETIKELDEKASYLSEFKNSIAIPKIIDES